MKIKIAVLAAVLSVCITACTTNLKDKSDEATLAEVNGATDLKEPQSELNEVERKSGSEADSVSRQSPTANDKQKKNQQPGTTVTLHEDWDKKIIKIAHLNVEVKDYNSFYTSVRDKIKSNGGYVAQEEQQQSDYKIENTLVIKIPVAQFDNALSQLVANTEKINERKITSQDVTAEYVDTRSRIEAKKQFRQRYIDLLKQAKNMEEILSVQSEINGIQEEIESATGRIEYLGHSSAYSTINLTYYQVLNPSASDRNNDQPSFGTKLSGAFRSGWSWIGDIFVGLVTVWPLFLLIFLAILWYKKARPGKFNEA